ncbi:hypothetical protein [Plantactinospora sp. DSM 117369]
MIDFFTVDGMPWPRRLWDVGSILALEELWEAGFWQARRVLSPAACDWQRNELRRVIGPDVGLGERDLRREITTLLNSPLPDPSPARRRLAELIHHGRDGYVERWARAAARPAADRPKPERLARTVAAHLLDLGYTPEHLNGWISRLSRDRATAPEVIESAAELARSPARVFEVLVALLDVPHRQLAEQVDNWLAKGDVVAWLKQRGHDISGLRVGGGIRYHVQARDPYAAADEARRLVDRMTARASFLRRSRDGIRPAESIWVDGHSELIPIASPARGADVLTLVHEGHLYRVDGARTQIDDALELAASVNRGALGPALAGAWAAVESLLSEPDDPQEEERSGKAVAADRLAAIIACSWPRAELTALAHRHAPSAPDALSHQLATCTTNRERSRVVAAMLASGTGIPDVSGSHSRTRHSDQAALERMTKLLADPRRVLGDVAAAFRIALRRLYRARNIVLHGGSMQGVALHAALRTATPLIGAGLDRLAHAMFTEELAPLDLAARAELALQLVEGETGLPITDLLEPRHVPASSYSPTRPSTTVCGPSRSSASPAT